VIYRSLASMAAMGSRHSPSEGKSATEQPQLVENSGFIRTLQRRSNHSWRAPRICSRMSEFTA
jgi:hypothetical protein